MDLSFIIIQMLSAIYNNDLTRVFVLSNAYKNISDTIGEGAINNPDAQVAELRTQIESTVSQPFYKSILINSLNSAYSYDPIACLVNTTRCLVKHADNALELVKEVEMYEACVNDRSSRKYMKYVSEACHNKHMLLTQLGLEAIENGEKLQLNHLISMNGYFSNSGLARMLITSMCSGAI